MTAVTKIVLRSQWGWWGGVKKLFKWINSPSHSAPPRSTAWIHDVVNAALRGSCRRCASAFAVFAVKHEPTPREQIGLSDLRGDLAASSGNLWPSHRAALLYSSPGSGIFPCQGFHPNPLLPFSHHLPRRLRCIPLLTSRPLMPFSIDHYPPLPLPLLVSAQSETPEVPLVWPLLMGGEEASIGDVRLFTLIWSMGSMCSSELLANLSGR